MLYYTASVSRISNVTVMVSTPILSMVCLGEERSLARREEIRDACSLFSRQFCCWLLAPPARAPPPGCRVLLGRRCGYGGGLHRGRRVTGDSSTGAHLKRHRQCTLHPFHITGSLHTYASTDAMRTLRLAY
jgi:hypothetical protein